MSASVAQQRHRRFGELPILAAMTFIGVALVAGLYLAARDEPSARSNHPEALPTPKISNDAACTNFATYWLTETGLRLDASIIEGLTNCRLGANGSWFVPTGPNDQRLPSDFAMTSAEREATNGLRSTLVAQIDDLEGTLSTSMQRDLDYIYDPRVRPISGHVKDGVPITRARSRYTRVVQAYLLAPEHEPLAAYVGWLMERKIDAFKAVDAQCQSDLAAAYLRTVCDGLEDSLSVRFPPFVWDLRSSVLLEAYLGSLVRSGQVPVPGASAASSVDAAGVVPTADRRLEG